MAYIPQSEEDRKRAARRDSGMPQYTTLEVPFSYAVAMTAHSYWTSVFLSRSPVFQFTARHGEPLMQVDAVEALIDYQVVVGGMMAPLFIWLLDPIKYGFGVMGVFWEEDRHIVSRIVEEEDTYLGVFKTGKKVKKRVVEEIPGYVGNRVYNVRPQDFFPDPRVPIGQFQQGEFVGRYVEVGWNTVLQRVKAGIYDEANVAKLRKIRSRKFSQRDEGSPQIVLPQAGSMMESQFTGSVDSNDMGYVALLEMYVELVPEDWGLGNTKYPEKWVFVLAEEEIVLHASPLGMYHNKFPFVVQEYEPDGYSLFSRSMMEVGQNMQHLLTWLVNTHLQNVRKSLNDMFVFDPSRIVVKDLLDPEPGKYVRLAPEYYGTDPRMAVHQLQVVDVTRGHMQDAETVMQMFQRALGVTDNVMGMLNPTGRRTATESRISTSFSGNRLKTNAEYMSAVGWGPLAQMLLQNTQQNYDLDRQYRVAGDLLGGAGQQAFVQVTPDSISGMYDFVPVDGTLPVDKFALATLWKELMAQMAASPQLLQMYDVGKVFAYTAKLAGAKNIDRFKLAVVPDDVMANRVQMGDSVPVTKAEPPATGMEQIPGMGTIL